jgi:uncharacterized protein
MLRSPRRLIALAALCVSSAFAVDFAALKPEGYLSDFARVTDPATRSQLERYCALVEAKTGAQMALVTIETLAGEPVEDVANALYRKWGVGRKETNEGVLLLLVTRDKRMRLEVGYGLEPVIPDGFAGGVLRSMRPALRENRYGEALLEAAQVLGSHIAQAKGVSLDGGLPRRAPQRRQQIPWPLVLGGLLLLFFLVGAGRGGGRRGGRGGGSGFLPALIVGNILGNAMSGGRGGGGFGGFDSGDSFGGFGGGDSGGGGASSSW